VSAKAVAVERLDEVMAPLSAGEPVIF
jgi:hypothetical protein